MRPLHPLYRKLCRTNRYTTRLTVPADFLQRHGLENGDEIEWTEEADGTVRLRFIKARGAELLVEAD
jgi:hypothetical protein